MKIAVLGAGAMGSLFSGYLSKNNEVSVIDVSHAVVDAIKKHGVRIKEKDGSVTQCSPNALLKSEGLGEQDLVIVFVKSMFTISALEGNKNLIGKNTYLMTLQNGVGHESKLLKFTDRKHIIIGSTQHNSSVIEPGFVNHGGSGITSIGLLDGGSKAIAFIAENFTSCGFECRTEDNVRRQVWNKMFTNTAASSLTALFQVPFGFIHTDANANFLMKQLCREAVEVANSLGLGFDLEEVVKDVDTVCANAPGGYTSIYADIRDGKKSEVDTISGSVVETAHDRKIEVPYHEFVVNAIHALENKNKENRECRVFTN
ncbi:2-dehydropantoate 2-reductase [Treponema parvum]|uniref:2-dehydropantoate 2-reductase n=1 Tax=Treponema parvum TaxID=138851 RepID=A0A975EZ22_9SPIR|nr:2-dehydropantoate 2-reductase [Treponema parvum]QTQ11539.1 2-dehydropantoate 2-reductase [Treponema parvum]